MLIQLQLGGELFWTSGHFHSFLSFLHCQYLLPQIVYRLTDTKSIMEQEKKVGEKEEERGQWSNPCDFFISCLGYAVGLGHLSFTKLIWFKGLRV